MISWLPDNFIIPRDIMEDKSLTPRDKIAKSYAIQRQLYYEGYMHYYLRAGHLVEVMGVTKAVAQKILSNLAKNHHLIQNTSRKRCVYYAHPTYLNKYRDGYNIAPRNKTKGKTLLFKL